MSRRLLAAIAALSLLTCIAVTVLWVRSYRAVDVMLRPSHFGDRVCITSEMGMLVFEAENAQRSTPKPGWVYFENSLPRRWHEPRGWFGFDAYTGTNRHYMFLPQTKYHGVTLPHWFVAITLLLWPACWLVSERKRSLRAQRLAHGLCLECGYDLRASLGRCPECGAGVGTPRDGVNV